MSPLEYAPRQPRNIQQIIAISSSIEALDATVMEQARARQLELAKPAGSFVRLEEIAIQIAGITHQVIPSLEKKVVVILAGDHGVTTEGVSALPSAVTIQVVHSLLRGSGAINALAREVGATVVIADLGVAGEVHSPDLIECKVAYGTANMANGPAMTHQRVLASISAGIDIAEKQVDQGAKLIAVGETGIGNTTAASAITAATLELPVAQVTGRGTGLNDAQLAHKVRIIERALTTNTTDAKNPLDVLTKVGGLEIARVVGCILGAGARRIPVVIDGFITGAAALIASKFNPHLSGYMIAGHASVEQGQQHILNLDLRLGAATGATLAMGIIEGALRTHREMLTFAEAGVSEWTTNEAEKA